MAKYPIPRPSELHLVDSKSDLEELKKNQPKVYLWRAVLGLLVLVFCAICGILLFRDAQNILNWFESLVLVLCDTLHYFAAVSDVSNPIKVSRSDIPVLDCRGS